ncbi:MAG: phenylalanine--tRNA ligase subunit beta [Chlamydiota bacterium]
MKIPLSWLKDYISLPFSPEDIAKTLTLSGIEVDAVEATAISFQGVIVAEVTEAHLHPNADRLKVAQVFDGKETFQVVCGAPNCRPGIKVAFATIGASLQDEKGPWKIKKGKIRDVESFGMLCSMDELGLSKEADGILELPSDTPLGIEVSSLYSDTVFTLSLTPNLGHCMSVYGVARELSAFFNIPLNPIDTEAKETFLSQPSVEVTVENEDLCPYYSARLVNSIQVGPSPDLIKRRLELSGIRSINNVVDISNYVMLATGQPLHFFDFDKIAKSKLQISSCPIDTTLETLDGAQRTVPAGALVIKDPEKILAIAGVMGACNAEITDQTQNILIEAAIFNPMSIRKTSRALSLKTDASSRFERGVDSEGPSLAIELATDLLIRFAGGKNHSAALIAQVKPISLKKITCRVKKVHEILGISLNSREIQELLTRLQIVTLKYHVDSLDLQIPTYRNDLVEEIDIIEEIARLYGFNNLPKSPALHISSPLGDAPIFLAENKARTHLLDEGLQEFLTCDLISPSLAELTKEKNDKHIETLFVLQSKSSDYSALRTSLLPGLLQVVKYNLDHQNQNIFGFEVGRIHCKEKESFLEQSSAAILLSGLNTPYHHDPKPKEIDFFDLKGIVENFLHAFKLPDLTFEVSHLHNFQPGRQAKVKAGDVILGALGEVNPFTLQELGIFKRVYFAELNLEVIHSLEQKKISVKELALYPASERDWTISLEKKTPIEDVLHCIKTLASPLLENVFLLAVFESEKIGLDRKNITWRFIYRDRQKTIGSDTVEAIHTDLLQKVAQKLGNCIL